MGCCRVSILSVVSLIRRKSLLIEVQSFIFWAKIVGVIVLLTNTWAHHVRSTSFSFLIVNWIAIVLVWPWWRHLEAPTMVIIAVPFRESRRPIVIAASSNEGWPRTDPLLLITWLLDHLHEAIQVGHSIIWRRSRNVAEGTGIIPEARLGALRVAAESLEKLREKVLIAELLVSSTVRRVRIGRLGIEVAVGWVHLTKHLVELAFKVLPVHIVPSVTLVQILEAWIVTV